MKVLEVNFPTEVLKVGKAIRVTCERISFESDCIIIHSHEFELTVVYFDKELDDLVQSSITIENAIGHDCCIEILN
ncbi:TPA: hypothetical protein KSS03_001997 [Clostridioides difficile]|uniref:hypothetical protein n=1 Tax=Clostridioides difficile TaxID=1496 RepID=UPI00093F95A9|nr:hypothetical protein [Clostridioides difficile]EGT5474292.1 hypothetical protein [Clostridioides difficile]MBG0256890.1 hypothetical protein [Clostridioides difficile]MDM9939377.1 hypothetical protein [Clostridioides difficile]SJO96709.1 Uncharacterised protein [Clostridioides difficile]SJP15819.1 Uncharacterised protein [Clostridioides difficile]